MNKTEPINEKEVIALAGESITEKPNEFIIDIKPKTKLHAWLIKRKLMPSKRYFDIRPQRTINIYRISVKAVKMDTGMLFQSIDTVGALIDVLARHGEDIFYIVACVIQNDHREPTKSMIDMVKNEFEMHEIQAVLKIGVNNYNLPAFLNSIALMVGVDALTMKKASPIVKAE